MSKRSPSGNLRSSRLPDAVEQQDRAAGGHDLAVVLDVLGDVAGLHGRGRLVAQQLLDGVRHEAAVLDHLVALVGVLGEHLARPADEPGRGLVAGRGEQVDVVQAPRRGSAGARVAGRRPRTRPGAARSSGRRRGARPASRCSRANPLGLVEPVVVEISGIVPSSRRRPSSMRSRIASWSCSGMPSSMPIVRIGIWRAEVGDEVEAARRRRAGRGCGRRTRGPSARWRSSCVGVNTRESRPRCRSWPGGSSKMIEPGGISMSLLISSRSVPLAELYVCQSTSAALDVVEPAQGVEVVALVVVERPLVPEPPPDRVRVGVDLEVVRVVVDVGLGGGHGRLPPRASRSER